MYLLTLQGPTVGGNLLLESWEIAPELYAHLRAHIQGDPLATTLTDSQAQVISQRVQGDETGVA